MYRIWWKTYLDGKWVGAAMSFKSYVRKGNAERAARKMLVDHGAVAYTWWVSPTNPWT